MNTELKKPKKGAGERLREFYEKLRKQPMSPELKETLQKKDQFTKNDPRKKSAKPDRDIEFP